MAYTISILMMVLLDLRFMLSILLEKHSAHNEKLAFLWHKRLDHISKERVTRLVKSEILSHLDFVNGNVCVDCIKGMQTSHSWYTLIFVVPLTFLLGVVKNISFFYWWFLMLLILYLLHEIFHSFYWWFFMLLLSILSCKHRRRVLSMGGKATW